MKKGIRYYYKYLSLSIGNAGTSFVNLNKFNREYIHEIPLFFTLSPYGFAFCLYYSYDETQVGLFGKGIKSTIEENAYFQGLFLKHYTSDFGEDLFYNKESNIYYSKKIDDLIVDETNRFVLKKADGSTVIFPKVSGYPIFTNKEGYSIQFVNIGNSIKATMTYDSDNKDTIELIKNNNLVSNIIYKRNNTIISYFSFIYNSNELIGIIGTNGTQRMLDIELTKTLYDCKIVNLITGEIIKSDFSCVSDVDVKRGYRNDMNEEYFDDYYIDYVSDIETRLTRNINNDSYTKKYYFDYNTNLLLLEIDEKGNGVSKEYNDEGNVKKITKSFIPNNTYNEISNCIFSDGLNAWEYSRVSVIQDVTMPLYSYNNSIMCAMFNQTGYLKRSYVLNGLPQDFYTLSYYVKMSYYMGNNYRFKISISAIKLGESVKIMSETLNYDDYYDNNWHLKSLFILIDEMYDNLTIMFESLDSYCSINVTGINLSKSPNQVSFDYDTYDRLVEETDGVNKNRYLYNTNNLLTEKRNEFDSELNIYSNYNKTTKQTIPGVYNIFVYNNNLLESKRIEHNQLIMGEDYLYDSIYNNLITKTNDSINLEENFYYVENYSKINKKELLSNNETKTEEYKYYPSGEIKKTKISGNNIYFCYNYKNLLTRLTINGQNQTDYNYEKHKLKKIYQETFGINFLTNDLGQLIEKKYDGLDSYHFHYDKDKISSISYKENDLSEEGIEYSFNYDLVDNLIEIKDKNNQTEKSFTYNKNRSLQSENYFLFKHTYFNYDVKNNMCEIIDSYQAEANIINENRINISNLIKRPIKDLKSKDNYYTAWYDDSTIGKSGDDGLYKNGSSILPNNIPGKIYGYDGFVPYLIVPNNRSFYYTLETTNNILAGFWFKIESNTNNYQLLEIAGLSNYRITFEVVSLTLIIKIISNDSSILYEKSEVIQSNAWTFASIRLNGTSLTVNINSTKTTETISNFIFDSETQIIVKDGSTYFTGLIVASNNVNDDSINEFFYTSKAMFELDKDIAIINTRTTRFGYTRESPVKEITLNGNNSEILGDTKPIELSILDNSVLFDSNYIDDIYTGRKVYFSNGEKLKYNLGQTSVGSVCLNFKAIDISEGYILSLKDSSNNTFSIYISNGILYYSCISSGGGESGSISSILLGIWYQIGICFNFNGTNKTATFKLNNITRTASISDTIPSTFDVYIGTTATYQIPFKGFIEDILYGSIPTTSLKVNNVSNKTKENAFGVIKEDIICYNESEIIKYKYRFHTTSNVFNPLPDNVQTTINNVITNSDITYGSFGLITNITNPSISIEYNYFGYVTKYTRSGVVEEYTYDSFGNITSIKENGTIISTYSYSLDNKTQLSVFNNKQISYSGGNTTQIGNDTLSFKGNRLVEYNMYDTSDIITYEYYYDGLRKKKTINNIVHNYFYSNGLLTKETYGNNVIDFVYGTNNRYIGFKYNGTLYYYVYNAIGNIEIIIDNNGVEQASYIYTAYGKIVNESSLSSIGAINPIRYKGYYYDTETSLYYLVSRYYNPEIGRFISPDNFDYIDIESFVGLNLYAYCSNNPVMYSDGSGHAPEWLKTAIGITVAVGLAALTLREVIASCRTLLVPVLTGAAIGAGVNLAGQGIGNVIRGKGFFSDINWYNVGLGAFTGAAFATGIGGLGGAIGIGAASNAGMSAFEGNSWINIGISGIVGGAAAGIGYGLGHFVSSKVFDIDSNISMKILREMTSVDGAGFLRGSLTVLAATGYTMAPTITTGLTRGLTKFLGKKIGDLL